MLKVLVERYLPVVFAVIGTAGIAGDVNRLIGWPWATILWGVAVAMILAQARADLRRTADYKDRLQTASAYIAEELVEASHFEKRLRTENPDLPVDTWSGHIDGWTARVEGKLRQLLPDTHADVRFGQAFGLPGHGDAVDRHRRLLALRDNLAAILDNLPAYVERSLQGPIRRLAAPR